jgi:hypothetical protein
MNKPNFGFQQNKLTTSVVMCPPAVRTVVCAHAAWRASDPGQEWDGCDDTYPVLAVVGETVSIFTKRGERHMHRPPTPSACEKAGWSFEGVDVSYDALIADDQFHELVPARVGLEGDNVLYRIVAAAWPPEEDGKRLAPVFEELRRDAQKKVIAHERRLHAKGCTWGIAPASATAGN